MGSKLTDSNRYLKNSAVRDRLVFKSVASSSAIEGIRAPFIGNSLSKRTVDKSSAKKRR